MTPTSFVREVGESATGDGFRRDLQRDLGDAFIFADGSQPTTTLTTNPGYAMAETNARVIQWAATKVVALGLEVVVPGDYDKSKDELRLRMELQSGGATDTPGITVNVYKKSFGAAITADLGPFTAKTDNGFGNASATSYAAGATSKLAIVDISGKGLVAGDVLYFKITPAAHGTDALNLYSTVVRYRGDLALFNYLER